MDSAAFYCERDTAPQSACTTQCAACAAQADQATVEYELDPMRCWPFAEKKEPA